MESKCNGDLEEDFNILDFPDEILLNIFSNLSQDDMFWSIGLTCKKGLYLTCERKIVIEVTNNLKDMNKLQDLSKYIEVLYSITHLVVWTFPEDYVSKNENISQNFIKFPRRERQYYIEKSPQFKMDSGLCVVIKVKDNKRDACSQPINAPPIVTFFQKCPNLLGFYWKATSDFRNRKSSVTVTTKRYPIDTKEWIRSSFPSIEYQPLSCINQNPVNKDGVTGTINGVHGVDGVRTLFYPVLSMAKDLKYLTICAWNDAYLSHVIRSLPQMLENLKFLDLTFSTTLTDEVVARISFHCKNLEFLDMSLCYKITDEGVKSFQQLRKLKGLVLSGCNNVRDDGIETSLTDLSELKYLDLSCCYLLTNHLLRYGISSLKSLFCIFLNNCKRVDDGGIHYMASNCPQLRTIEIENCNQVTCKGLISISAYCKHLKVLNLNGIENITDIGISAICSNCPELEILELENAENITLHGFQKITCCKKLGLLNVNGCPQLTLSSIQDIILGCSLLQALDIRRGCEIISIEEKNTLTELAPSLKVGQNFGAKGKRHLSMFQIFEDERFRNEYKIIRDCIIRSIYPVFDAYKETEYI